MSSKLPPGFFDASPPPTTTITPSSLLQPGQPKPSKMGPPAKLPGNFFDASQNDKARFKSPQARPEKGPSGIIENDRRAKLAAAGAQGKGTGQVKPAGGSSSAVESSSAVGSLPAGGSGASVPKKDGDTLAAAASGTKLPEGFFDDVAADSKARGVEFKKADIKDELQEFEKSIKRDLDQAQQREDAEEGEAADEREEREALAQSEMKERVARFRYALQSRKKRPRVDSVVQEGDDDVRGRLPNDVPERDDGAPEHSFQTPEGQAGDDKNGDGLEVDDEVADEEEDEDEDEDEDEYEDEDDDGGLRGDAHDVAHFGKDDLHFRKASAFDWRAKRV